MAARPTPISPHPNPFDPRDGDGPEVDSPLIDWRAVWAYLAHGDFFNNHHLTLPKALGQLFFWVFALFVVSTVSAISVMLWFVIVAPAIP